MLNEFIEAFKNNTDESDKYMYKFMQTLIDTNTRIDEIPTTDPEKITVVLMNQLWSKRITINMNELIEAAAKKYSTTDLQKEAAKKYAYAALRYEVLSSVADRIEEEIHGSWADMDMYTFGRRSYEVKEDIKC